MGLLPRIALLVGVLSAAAAHGAPLRYAEDRAPGIVNPLFSTTMSEARLNELVFEGLFTDDRELRSVPLLAESWELARDRRSMTVTLRRDVLWHDGMPLSARDVVFTIQAMRDRATASTELSRVAFIADVVALDARTVRLVFRTPEYAPEDKLHFAILPAHAFSGVPVKRTHAFRNKPVGSGPWRVERFNDDNSISLEAFRDYREPVGLPEVTMREVADKNYQSKLLIYESLEALVRVLPRDLAALQADRRIELYPYQTNSWWYLGFNLQDPRFADARVREGLHRMIDIDALLRPIGTGDVLTGPFVRSSPFYDHTVEARGHDPSGAAELLEAAGYVRTGRQWTRAGQPFTIRIATLENLETAQDVLVNLQSQLRAQGVTVEPVFLNAAEWRRRVWGEHDFDLVLSQWSFDRNEDVHEQFHSRGTRNFVGYASAEVDRLLDQARTAADPQQKKQLLRGVHRQVAHDVPMVFLWTLDSYSAMSVRVKNVVVHPFYFFTWARDWTAN